MQNSISIELSQIIRKSFPTFFIFFCSIVSFASQSQAKNGYRIHGSINALPEKTKLYLIRDKDKTADTVSITAVKNGTFEFTGMLDLEGEFYWIRPSNSIASGAPLTILLTNSSISLSGDASHWPYGIQIKGAPAQIDYESFIKLLTGPKEELEKINSNLELLHKQVNYSIVGLDSLTKAEYFKAKKQLTDRSSIAVTTYNKAMIEYIFKNPKSLYTPFLIARIETLLSRDSLYSAYSNLSYESKTSFYGTKLGDILNNMNHLKIGNTIPDFQIEGIDGEKYSIFKVLSKSKITLIDFWASWCKPCRELTPQIATVYKKFNNKGFNVISISSDKDHDSWLKAIKEDNMIWDHCRSQEAQRLFDVNAIPAFVLIDSTGKIISYHMTMSKVSSGQNDYFMDDDKLTSILSKLLP